ncbi:hypothetical protein [Telmatospirillum sp.]|uniref:hypothetical protein n=1 Tax=Telmatospirillum sp. TaxID=2079197 RepID=UPI0028404AB0|nr:hypothetical protein [Telmatospirillum sp.]MDR3440592.1 hypothetical protein [Telmatospirillum sp.]
MTSVVELSSDEVGLIKARIQRGDKQHRIAADYDLNQGRISEIKHGKLFPDIPPADKLN